MINVRPAEESEGDHAVVGTWWVVAARAPFRYHLMVFRLDGGAIQLNPHEGNPGSSDTPAVGEWRRGADDTVEAAFVEIRLDRRDGTVTRGELRLRARVSADRLAGEVVFRVRDVDGRLLPAPAQATAIDGQRIRWSFDDGYQQAVGGGG